ncbi:MAG: GTP-binding protein [Woeseiaceae bacterium]|nr:GTP-binding protein [Woeseiaceae bacterium]
MKSLSIITGFLGSGKTTLLNRLLKDPAMGNTAVLINELGAVGIDNLIVDEFDDDIVLLESGCVCCSVRDDLTLALLNLFDRSERGDVPTFEQAVLETTGVADPAGILQLLMADEDVCERYVLGNVVTLVDACFAPQNLTGIPEAARQVQMADRLVVSKTDLVSGEQSDQLRSRLRELNTVAPLLTSAYATPEDLFANTPQYSERPALPDHSHGTRFTTFQVRWEEAVEWSQLETWLEGLLSARGEDILRIKGVVNVAGEARPTVLQSVQHSAYEPMQLAKWPGGEPYSELTFIAQNFSQAAAYNSLRPFIGESLHACYGT